MKSTLSPAEIEAFREDGVTLVRGAVDAPTVARMSAAVADLIGSPSKRGGSLTAPGRPGMYFQDRHLFPHRPAFAALLRDTGLAAMAARAMGSEQVRIFFDHVFVKEPGTQERFVWHQDRPYWNVDGTQVCSTWVALTWADVASSALEFVRGSHRWGKTYRPEYPGLEGRSPAELEARLWRGIGAYVESFEEACPSFEAQPERYDILSFAVEPGDALLFDFRTVHRSGPNSGATRRAAISWRWLGDDAVWAPKPGGDPIVSQRDTFLRPGDPITDDAVFPVVFRA